MAGRADMYWYAIKNAFGILAASCADMTLVIGKLLKWSLYLALQLVKLALEALKIVLLLICSVLKIFLLVLHGGRCK